MASFKKLSKSDVTVVPYYANKQWNLSYCPYPTSSEYLTIYNGTNLTGSFSSDDDPITENQYERLIYSQINQLFYQEYPSLLNTSSLANSVYYESASQQRPTSSYFIYNDSKNLITSFPTGAMAGIRVLAINQEIYGNKILPNHFILSSSAYSVTDDGYGNLYNGNTHIGNIFYAHGLGVITNQDYQLMFPLPPIAKNDIGYFLTTDTPKTISASLNDYARSGTLNTSSLAFSGSISGIGYSWATGSNGTVILTATTPGTYEVWYTTGADIAGSCAINLRSNKAKITAIVTSPTTTSTTTTTTTVPTTTTTTTSTTSTTTTVPTTTTTTTSTTSTTTTVPTTTTSTTSTTTTIEPTTTTSTTTTTTTTLSFLIGFGGASEDACNFLASATVIGDNSDFCSCTTFTGAIFSAAATGTYYVSFGGQYVSVSVVNGNPVATVTSACSTCSPTTTTTTTSTTTSTTTVPTTTSTTTSTTTAEPMTTSTTTSTTTVEPTTTTSTTTTTTTAGFYSYEISSTSDPDPAQACLLNYGPTVYAAESTSAAVTRFYTDMSLTTPLGGTGDYYRYTKLGNSDNVRAQVNVGGYVSNIGSC